MFGSSSRISTRVAVFWPFSPSFSLFFFSSSDFVLQNDTIKDDHQKLLKKKTHYATNWRAKEKEEKYYENGLWTLTTIGIKNISSVIFLLPLNVFGFIISYYKLGIFSTGSFILILVLIFHRQNMIMDHYMGHILAVSFIHSLIHSDT